MNRHLAILPVSADLLREALRLPDSVRIVNVSLDMNYDCVLLRLEGPDFPEVREGAAISRTNATFRKSDDGQIEFVEWV
jgi:hypothetical protein